MTLRAHVFDTALGRSGVAWTADGLARVLLPGGVERRLRRLGALPSPPPPGIAAIVDGLLAHSTGAPAEFADAGLDEAGIAAFDRAVYAALRRTTRGTTITYGALAAAAGVPGAARDVGAAMGRNPWPVVVPCHRVLAAAGRLGGFSAPGGAETKRRLLALEGVVFGGTPDLPGLFDAETR